MGSCDGNKGRTEPAPPRAEQMRLSWRGPLVSAPIVVIKGDNDRDNDLDKDEGNRPPKKKGGQGKKGSLHTSWRGNLRVALG